MLLVMDTTGLFNMSSSDLKICQLRDVTKDRIDSFLPGLWQDLFKERKNNIIKNNENNIDTIDNNNTTYDNTLENEKNVNSETKISEKIDCLIKENTGEDIKSTEKVLLIKQT
jgi:hypothetical protein